MLRRFDITLSLVILVSGLFSVSVAGQNAASLDEQLRAQYKMVKMGSDAEGLKVVNPGTVLDVQKGGILGVIPKSVAMCPSKFENGDLKRPIAVIECDSCNGVNQESSYKGEVIFQFAKGTLEKTTVPQVEDMISQVLAIDEGGSQGGNDAQQQNQNAAPAQGQQADQAPAPPVSIQSGQTIDQVVAALGQPEKIVSLGAKQIYVYKDLKVTFENGKVKDVN